MNRCCHYHSGVGHPGYAWATTLLAMLLAIVQTTYPLLHFAFCLLSIIITLHRIPVYCLIYIYFFPENQCSTCISLQSWFIYSMYWKILWISWTTLWSTEIIIETDRERRICAVTSHLWLYYIANIFFFKEFMTSYE